MSSEQGGFQINQHEKALNRRKMIPPQKKSNRLTRRAFLSLAGAAALAALFPVTKAYAVGGGAWGNYGSTATPGSQFGYDAEWSYSYDSCVWLSARVNCTVNWLTELYVSVTVDASVACGGIWNPTWSPDMPDTPTYAYIRDAAGTWLASAYWTIDTTYDHDWYVYMTGTSLVVERYGHNWWAYCGADIKGLGGSAPGTHSTAEATQLMPHHTLINDTRWRNRIVTVRPKPAPKLYLDCVGGGVVTNTNIVHKQLANTTNQNWIVIASPFGRESLVPVHVGATGMYLDVAEPGGLSNFNNGNNVKLFPTNTAKANSVWMHHLGSSYYMFVHEHNGMCLNLDGGKTTNGTNANNWDNYCRRDQPNMQFLVEEVVFREKTPGIMNITGAVKTGQTITVPNPNTNCYPYNHPATTGMYWKYTYYTGASKGTLTNIVRAPSEVKTYTVKEADENQYLTCVITAFARFRNTPYAGKVQTKSVLVPTSMIQVEYFSDGATTPCFKENVRIDAKHSVPAAATTAATKAGCAGLDGWYVDSGYKTKFVNATTIKSATKLYARNAVMLEYSKTDRSCINNSEHKYYLDETCTKPISDAAILPSKVKTYYGETIVFPTGATVYFKDMGQIRTATCNPGAYPSAAATNSPIKKAKLICNTVVYLDWLVSSYDGVTIS